MFGDQNITVEGIYAEGNVNRKTDRLLFLPFLNQEADHEDSLQVWSECNLRCSLRSVNNPHYPIFVITGEAHVCQ